MQRMVEFDEVFAELQLRIGQGVGACGDDVCWYALCLQGGLDFLGGRELRPCFDDFVEESGLVQSISQRRKAFVLREFYTPNERRELLPFRVVAYCDGHPRSRYLRCIAVLPIAAGIHAMGSHLQVTVAHTLRDMSLREIVGYLRRQESDPCFRLGNVDIAALTSPTVMVQGGKQHHQGETRPDVLGIGAQWPGGRPVRPANKVREARHRSTDVAVASEGRVRSRRAHERRAQHDQLRVDLAYGLVVQAP